MRSHRAEPVVAAALGHRIGDGDHGLSRFGAVMPFNSGGWKLINAAIAVIVLAQMVHYGVAVWSYRRGRYA